MSKKLRHDGSIKFSDPVKVKEPEKLIDYDSFSVRHYKPNKIKIDVAHGENRFPEGSEPPSSKKYDKAGNNIKHKERIIKKESKSVREPNVHQIMRENDSGNPSKYKNGKKRR